MRPNRKVFVFIFISALLAFLALTPDALAQTNTVFIRRPQPGSVLQGVVTIEGSAYHPDFEYYQLSFTYADLSSQTWFLVSEASTTPVTNDALGIWDTNNITDGNYHLRLEVGLTDGTVLSAVVEDLRIRNTTPVETNTPAPIVETLTPSPIPPTPTYFPTPISLSAANGQSGVVLNLCLGAFGTLLIFSALAAYIQTSRATRLSLGSLRMRWLHWRENRRQRGKKL
jgi:hypothetical protein